jgi:hypothetical protein
MKYYNDNDNRSAAKVMFMLFQMCMLLIVYGFIYTSLVAVKLAIVKYHLTFMSYVPEIIALVGFPVVLYKTRRMFDQEKRLRAAGLVMAWAAVIIVFLYLHLSQLVGV